MINQRFAPIEVHSAQNLRGRRARRAHRNPFVFFVLGAALLVSLGQTGCIGLTGASATDPTTTATMAVGGATGSFGTVATGSSSTQTFIVTNTGSTALTITQLAATGGGFSVSGFTLPITVAAGKGTTFTIKFAPSTAVAMSGKVSITANTSPTVSTITLTGTGASAGQAVMSVSPTSVNFGTAAIGTTLSQDVIVSNSGPGSLTLSNVTVSGSGFALSNIALPVTITAGQNTPIRVSMLSLTAGNLTGGVTITTNSTTPSVVVGLSGTSTTASQPLISVLPGTVAFGTVAVGQTMTQTVTITNPSSSTLTISNVAAAGLGFSISGVSLPITILPGQSTTFKTSVVPSSTGGLIGSVTIANNSTTPDVVVGLTATGGGTSQPGISVSPSSIAFGNVTVGAPNSQAILIQNTGNATLTISQATVSGTGFSISGLGVPATIAAGTSTTFTVAFGPTGAGAVSGSVSLVSNAPGSPASISLSGTGVASTMSLNASTTGVAFGSVAVGSNASQNVTLTNNGNSIVTIASVNVSGTGFSSTGVTAGQTIGAGQSATLGVVFAPTSATTVAGSVTVISSATNSPITISLSGTGTQAVAHSVTLTWAASTSSVVGYNVYRSTISGGPYTLITGSPVAVTTFTDNSVQAGVTYFYVVTSVDASGNESAYSNEASVTVPTP